MYVVYQTMYRALMGNYLCNSFPLLNSLLTIHLHVVYYYVPCVGSHHCVADGEGCGLEPCHLHDSPGDPGQCHSIVWCPPWRAH